MLFFEIPCNMNCWWRIQYKQDEGMIQIKFFESKHSKGLRDIEEDKKFVKCSYLIVKC